MTPSKGASHTHRLPYRFLSILLKALAVSFAWLNVAPMFSQEPSPAQTAPRTFRDASGVRIEVTPERANVSDAEVLTALEAAARQVRERLALPPSAPTSPDPVTQPSAGGDPFPIASAPSPGAEPVTELSARHLELFPRTVLWQPPMANQHEPRMSIVPTNLDTTYTKETLNTAIGGTAPLLGLCRDDCPHDGWQLDFFGVVLTRFANYNTLEDADYRFGIPLTWASGPWEAKLAYEHTSCHLGDDYIKLHPGTLKQGHVRDEGRGRPILSLVGSAASLWPVRLRPRSFDRRAESSGSL